MRKFLLTLLVLMFLALSANEVFADTVNMINGTVLKGKIERISGKIINMHTKQGYRKFSRNHVLNNRDFIVVGFLHKKVITGTIFVATKWYIHMYTPEGILELERWKVRDVILGHVHQPEEDLNMQLPEQVTEDEKNLEDFDY